MGDGGRLVDMVGGTIVTEGVGVGVIVGVAVSDGVSVTSADVGGFFAVGEGSISFAFCAQELNTNTVVSRQIQTNQKLLFTLVLPLCTVTEQDNLKYRALRIGCQKSMVYYISSI